MIPKNIPKPIQEKILTLFSIFIFLLDAKFLYDYSKAMTENSIPVPVVFLFTLILCIVIISMIGCFFDSTFPHQIEKNIVNLVKKYAKFIPKSFLKAYFFSCLFFCFIMLPILYTIEIARIILCFFGGIFIDCFSAIKKVSKGYNDFKNEVEKQL